MERRACALSLAITRKIPFIASDLTWKYEEPRHHNQDLLPARMSAPQIWQMGEIALGACRRSA